MIFYWRKLSGGRWRTFVVADETAARAHVARLAAELGEPLHMREHAAPPVGKARRDG